MNNHRIKILNSKENCNLIKILGYAQDFNLNESNFKKYNK